MNDPELSAQQHRARELSRQSLGRKSILDREISADRMVPMTVTDLIPANLSPANGVLSVREVVHRIVPVSPVVKSKLCLDDDDVLMVEQLISLGDEPLFHAIGYSPLDTAATVLSALHALGRRPGPMSMRGLFEEMFSTPLARIDVSVGAVRTETRIARMLGIDSRSAALVREFTLYDQAGRARSYNFTHFRADRVRMEAQSQVA